MYNKITNLITIVIKIRDWWCLYVIINKSDVTDINDVNILAPECQNMEIYFNRLIIICILHCYKEFALCIYKDDPMPTDIKKNILGKMHKGQQPSKQQRTKLDNYLNMYKVYLQRKSQDIINQGMRINIFRFRIFCPKCLLFSF